MKRDAEIPVRTYSRNPKLSRLKTLREAVEKSELGNLLKQDVLYALDELARFKVPQEPPKLRLCVVCGARVTNINPKTVTCSRACQIAKDYNISRQRALRLLEDQPDTQP